MSRKNEEDVVTSRKRVLVTPHSHIDTEWYWSFSDTIAWSCEILHLVAERLRKDPAYRFGQDQVTIWAPVLARLDERDRKELIDAVTEGRIEPLGGMWTASELAEPGGESLVRQLQEGQRWMEAVLGRSARTAWFIDQFGQVPQLPQILAGAGFSAYVFGRDLPPDRPIDEFPADFWYVGPDGSRIQAHWMPGHYGDITDEELPRRLAEIGRHSRGPLWLLPWGGDVVRPEESIVEISSRVAEAAARAGLGEVEVELATPAQYLHEVMESIGELPEIDWDFNPPFRRQDLRGTYDNRILLKMLNRRCEEALLSLEALASQLGEGRDAGHDGSWRHLLFTQFHDTIGGSCSDDVYERAMARLSSVLSLAQARTFELLGGCGDAGPSEAVVFNPTLEERVETVQFVPPDPTGDWAAVSGTGDVVLATAQDAPAEPVRCRVRLGPLSGTVVRLVPAPPSELDVVHPVHGEDVVRTGRYEVTLEARTGEVTKLVRLADQSVVWSEESGGPGGQVAYWEEHDPDLEGDLHLSGRRELLAVPAADVTVTHDAIGVRICVTHEVWGGRLRREWHLPNDEERIDCTVELAGVALGDGLVLLGVPVSAEEGRRILYETPFAVTQRPEGHFPAQAYVAVEDTTGRGIALFNRGTPGYWVEGDRLYLVLMRKAHAYLGYVSRAYDDASASLRVRPFERHLNRFARGGKDTTLAGEEGLYRFELALFPYTGGLGEARVAQAAHAYNRPLLSRLGPAQRRLSAVPLVQLEGLPVVVDALRPAHPEVSGAALAWVMRFHEPAGRSGVVRLACSDRVRAVRRTDLLERPVGEPLGTGTVEVAVGPFEIVSVLLLSADGRE